MNRIEKHIQHYTNTELSKFKAPIERQCNICRSTLNKYIKNIDEMPTTVAKIFSKKLNITLDQLVDNE